MPFVDTVWSDGFPVNLETLQSMMNNDHYLYDRIESGPRGILGMAILQDTFINNSYKWKYVTGSSGARWKVTVDLEESNRVYQVGLYIPDGCTNQAEDPSNFPYPTKNQNALRMYMKRGRKVGGKTIQLSPVRGGNRGDQTLQDASSVFMAVILRDLATTTYTFSVQFRGNSRSGSGSYTEDNPDDAVYVGASNDHRYPVLWVEDLGTSLGVQ